MRNLIILLAILAFALTASPALAQCPVFGDTLEVAKCEDLPESGAVIDPNDCDQIAWYFNFSRTDKTTGRCIVIVSIKDSEMEDIEIDSQDFIIPDKYSIDFDGNYGIVEGCPVQSIMKHHPVHNDSGMFVDLEFWYNITEPE